MAVIRLISGTIGSTTSDAAVGDSVTVKSPDENGNPITETGIVAEILED